MQIVIKNLGMPIGCQKCKFFCKHLFGNGLDYSYSCILGAKDFPMPWIRQMEERASDCPIEPLEQEPCEDCISRADVINTFCQICQDDSVCFRDKDSCADLKLFRELPSVQLAVTLQPKTGHCKDCKWWKDSDGIYRRGGHAESQCPINRREVLEGNGYCYMFEPPGSEE